MSDLSNFSSYDDKNKTAAPLLGDSYLNSVRSTLANSTVNAVAGLPSGSTLDSLAVIGIRGSAGGQLTVDDTALTDLLDSHFDEVVNLFTQSFTGDDSKIGFVSSSSATVAGKYDLVANYDATGKLVSATINGKAATVDGQLIRGVTGTTTDGLVLNFVNPGSGVAGTVNTTFGYSQGASGLVASAAASINDADYGPIHFAQDAINQSNASLDKQIADWTDRLTAEEAALRQEYTNLETLISQMKNQSAQISGTLG